MSIVDDGRFLNKAFHMHIGSQIRILTRSGRIETMSAFADDKRGATDTPPVHKPGGGFGIKYVNPTNLSSRRDGKESVKMRRYSGRRRSNVLHRAGTLGGGEARSVYKVGYLKDTETLHHAFADGGMSDNIRPALYGWNTPARSSIENDEPKNITIAGKNVNPGIIIIHARSRPVPTNDYLIVYAIGAMDTMASNTAAGFRWFSSKTAKRIVIKVRLTKI